MKKRGELTSCIFVGYSWEGGGMGREWSRLEKRDGERREEERKRKEERGKKRDAQMGQGECETTTGAQPPDERR